MHVVLFGTEDQRKTGYRLTLSEKRALLAKDEKTVGEAAFRDATLSSVELTAAAGQIRFQANGKTIVEWQDPNPLAEGFVGADLGPLRGANLRWSDWRDRARVTSSHRIDYSFDHAPAAIGE